MILIGRATSAHSCFSMATFRSYWEFFVPAISYIHAVSRSCEAPRILKRTPETYLLATLWSSYHMRSAGHSDTLASWALTLVNTSSSIRARLRMGRLTKTAWICMNLQMSRRSFSDWPSFSCSSQPTLSSPTSYMTYSWGYSLRLRNPRGKSNSAWQLALIYSHLFARFTSHTLAHCWQESAPLVGTSLSTFSQSLSTWNICEHRLQTHS